MGLNFSHCSAHWSYGGFNRFRAELARLAGFEWPASLDGQEWDRCMDMIERSIDPIKELLLHSDCEGELEPEKLKEIIPRLSELLDKLPPDDERTKYDIQQGRDLVQGMKKALENNEPLEFK